MTNKRSEIEQMILQSSPILEAFGNAKTVRNNNSSRFGKLIEIHFDANGYISGARITQYLLERSRIVQQAAQERNYHIFYQLLAGCTDQERQRLRLTDASRFRYLNQSGCVQIDGWDDEALFAKTRTALSYLGMSDRQQEQILQVLAAILHLGNLEFEPQGDGSRLRTGSASVQEAMRACAEMLGLDPDALARALTNRSMNVRGQVTVIPLRPEQAVEARDALAKAIYARLFEWLVSRINQAIHRPGQARSFIAVLDIFGFENFKRNSFEQLCINYTNEKLQLHFNEHIFKLEQEEYAREKIQWSRVDFKDNQGCIDLIEKSTGPPGLLALLDEECRFPKATDATYLDKITQQHQPKQQQQPGYFERPKGSRTAFVIRHYAGEVQYETEGFLDKNKDVLQADLLALLLKSKQEVVRQAFEVMAGSEESGAKVRTVAGNFKNQLIALVNTLSSTQTHYVRTIKPNTLQRPDCFDADMVLAQLRYAGMLETVRIRKMGYPVRFQLAEFCKRYGLIVSGPASTFQPRDPRGSADQLLRALAMPAGTYQLGLTKVFLRDYQAQALEERRNKALLRHIVRLQAFWRMMRVRLWYLHAKGAAIQIQKSWRAVFYRRRFLKQRSAAIILQAALRGGLTQRRTFERLKQRRAEIKRRLEEEARRRKEEEERRRQEAAKEESRRREEAERQRKEAERALKEGRAVPVPAAAPAPQIRSAEDLLAPPAVFGPLPTAPAPAAPSAASVSAAAARSSQQAETVPEFTRVDKARWRPYRRVQGLEEAPPVVTEENVPAYPWVEYGDKHFRKPNQMPKKAGTLKALKASIEGTLRRRGGTSVPTFNDLIGYQRTPLQCSLLNLEEHLSKQAVDAFAWVLAYMHPPEKEKKPTDPLLYATGILRLGVTMPALRDELYCQLVKQTFVAQFAKPPPREIILRAWELLAFASGSFLPSAELQKYVGAYFLANSLRSDEPQIAQVAAFCLSRFSRAVYRSQQRGGGGMFRLHVPSAAELALVRSGKAFMTVQVQAPDGSRHDLELDCATSANEAMALLAKRLSLQDVSHWAIYESFVHLPGPNEANLGRLERSLFVEEVVLDSVSKASAIPNFRFSLVFRRKIYLQPRVLPEDPVELTLLYYQACEEVQEGTLPTSEADAAKIAAFRLQHDIGDLAGRGASAPYTLESYLPRPHQAARRRTPEQWRQMIATEHELLRGLQKEQVRRQLLSFVSQLSLYGATLVPVENRLDKTLPSSFELMINHEGLHFAKPEGDTRRPWLSIFFTDFSVQYSPETCTIVYTERGQPKTLELHTRRGPEIWNLYSDYFFWLQAQSEWARAIEDYDVNEAGLLSFKKGELLHVLDKEDPEWYQGESLDRKRRGAFPVGHVVMLLRVPPEVKVQQEQRRKPAAGLAAASASAAGAKGGPDPRKRISAMIRPVSGIRASVRASIRAGASASSSSESVRASFRGSVNPRLSQSPFAAAAKNVAPPTGPRWAAIAVDPARFRWEAYATAHFRKGKSGAPANTPHFTKDPIKESLLPTEDSATAAAAVDAFKLVMRYMEDLPRGKASEVQLVQALCREGIERPALRDELFAALLKQLSRNPKLESQGKGFGLLCVLCGMFQPADASLFQHLVAFLIENTQRTGLETYIAELSADCLERLTRQRECPNVQRQQPPGRQEIEAVIGGGQLAALIYLEDGSSRTIDIDSWTTASEIVEQLPGELRSLRGWYLFETISAGVLYTEHILKPNDTLCDAMARWERFQLPKGIEGEVEFRFVFRKYVFLKADLQSDLAKPTPAMLLFHQVSGMVVRGRLPVQEDDAVFLAACHLQYELGNASANSSFNLEASASRYLPRHFVQRSVADSSSRKGTTSSSSSSSGTATLGRIDLSATIKGSQLSALLQRVRVTWSQLQDKQRPELIKMYILKAQESPMFGAILFPVQYAVTRKQVKHCLLAVNEEGCQIWEPGAKAPARRIPFAEIASFGPKKGQLTIVSGSLIDPATDLFLTEESFEIADVLKAYQTAKSGVVLSMRKGFL
jgi:hypothetical protein